MTIPLCERCAPGSLTPGSPGPACDRIVYAREGAAKNHKSHYQSLNPQRSLCAAKWILKIFRVLDHHLLRRGRP